MVRSRQSGRLSMPVGRSPIRWPAPGRRSKESKAEPMTIRNLDHLLKPRAIALVGASPKAGSVGLITLRNLRAGGFAGPIWLVNPKYRAIEGQDCFSSVSALPAAPDLGVVATPPETVPDIVAELGAKGARAAVIITAGVRRDLKRQMLE